MWAFPVISVGVKEAPVVSFLQEAKRRAVTERAKSDFFIIVLFIYYFLID
jgi:hypothetical protein